MKDRQLTLLDWMENDFRQAVLDDDRVLEAAAVLKVAKDKGDAPIECIRRCIAAFVIDLIEPGSLDSGKHTWVERN